MLVVEKSVNTADLHFGGFWFFQWIPLTNINMTHRWDRWESELITACFCDTRDVQPFFVIVCVIFISVFYICTCFLIFLLTVHPDVHNINVKYDFIWPYSHIHYFSCVTLMWIFGDIADIYMGAVVLHDLLCNWSTVRQSSSTTGSHCCTHTDQQVALLEYNKALRTYSKETYTFITDK